MEDRPILAEPLTQSAFSPFGTVIETPSSIAEKDSDPQCPATATVANQGSALKYANASPLESRYRDAPWQKQAEPTISLFVCSPRPLKRGMPSKTDDNVEAPTPEIHPGPVTSVFELTVLERHPYTTQTFIPMGLDPEDRQTAYLVIVAPTALPAAVAGGVSGDAPLEVPDENAIRAFVCRGSQGVTYGVGVWHAPMVVIGVRPVSFVVTQFVNGVEADDCDERATRLRYVEVPALDPGVETN